MSKVPKGKVGRPTTKPKRVKLNEQQQALILGFLSDRAEDAAAAAESNRQMLEIDHEAKYAAENIQYWVHVISAIKWMMNRTGVYQRFLSPKPEELK